MAVQELAERAKLRAELQVAVAERQQTCRALTAGIMALTPSAPQQAVAGPATASSQATHAARGKPIASCFTPQTPADVASAVSRASRLVASDRHSRFLESMFPSAAAVKPTSPVIDSEPAAGRKASPSSIDAANHLPDLEDRNQVENNRIEFLCQVMLQQQSLHAPLPGHINLITAWPSASLQQLILLSRAQNAHLNAIAQDLTRSIQNFLILHDASMTSYSLFRPFKPAQSAQT